jgi:ubiquinone/menaquinone biosynthesis C-methylase UbiE
LTVVVVDFVRGNLAHAQKHLAGLVDSQVYLVHGDATNLPFADNMFDGYWSVQTLQHVPSFKQCIAESHRVLKHGGQFANYSLNNEFILAAWHKCRGRSYHLTGQIDDSFFMERACAAQRQVIAETYGQSVRRRFSEILFHPDFHLAGTGTPDTMIGRLDACLTGIGWLFAGIARQCSYHVQKQTAPVSE